MAAQATLTTGASCKDGCKHSHNSILWIMGILIFAINAFTQDLTWYNNKTSPYTISTEAELRGLAQLVNNQTSNFEGKTVLLGENIALTSSWTPIGSGADAQFKGTFDGQGKTISGLSVSSGTYVGLFGYVGAGGQIKNVNVIGTKIKGSQNVGGLVAYYVSSKAIENTTVKLDSVIIASTVNSTYSGGLVGRVGSAFTIANSYAIVNVSSTTSYSLDSAISGGLVGYAAGALTITNSYASGNDSSTSNNSHSFSGGLVGYAYSALAITNSYASGNVSSNVSSTSSYSYNSYSGGLVGYARAALTITNSYASGNVSSKVSYTSSTSNTSTSYSGGLVGYVYNASTVTSTIETSYASGKITAEGKTSYAGGIFGRFSYGTNTSVYYNSDGAANAAGSGSPTGILYLDSEGLKIQGNYLNWDFDKIWGIIEGNYPYLKVNPGIVTVPLGDIEIEYAPAAFYTGSQIKPEPIVRLTNKTVLEQNVDYVLSYGANKNVGTGTITITGIGDYSSIGETIEFNITPKPITLSDVEVQNKEYDGTTEAKINAVLNGVVNGDEVSITGTFADKNVGENKAISNVALTGAQAGNYSIIPPTDLKANITKKLLTITLDPKTVTIAESDPISVVKEHIVFDGFVDGENSSIIGGTTTISILKGGEQLIETPEIGTHPITISGTANPNNYEISYDNADLFLKVVRDPINLSTCSASDISNQTYSGEQIKPSVTVTCGGTTLEHATDYTLTYGTNKEVDETGTVTINGIDGYKGSITKTFEIEQLALTVTGATAENKDYDGTAAAAITGATLSGVIGSDEVSLVDHTTGTFASANAGENIAVSTNMSITGAAAKNYSLIKPNGLTANITQKSLPENAIQTIPAQTYTGSNITPAITAKDGSKSLVSGVDYNETVVFANNRNAGTATVTITGKGNYKGTAKANFTINAKNITSGMIEEIPAKSYTGEKIEPTVIVKDGSKILSDENDFEVSYSDNIEPGIATVTITGKGNYQGTEEVYFHIGDPKYMDDLEISSIDDQFYTGNPITVSVTIKDGSYTLQAGVDYKVDKYTDNVNIGTALIQISGIGSYAGTTIVPFEIVAPQLSSSDGGNSSSSDGGNSSSSSDDGDSSSSSEDEPSSSSGKGNTPIMLPQIANANSIVSIKNGLHLTATNGATVKLFNIKGTLISSQNYSNGVYNIPLAHLPKGMYVAKVSFGSESKVIRTIIR